jgi:phospholipid/cholesterol/gamma-HCH transport system permease protein
MSPEATLAWFRGWGTVARFAFAVAAAASSPSSYTPRMLTIATKQIYFTAWQALVGFILFSALFTVITVEITVGAARGFGLEGYALELVFRALVLEMLPLLTALMVALRSGAAISTEVALMRIGGDLDRMRNEDIDPLEREFLPRVLATAASLVSLTVMSCSVALIAAYVSMYGFTPWGFEEYTRVVAQVFSPAALAGFTLRCVAFGVAVAIIPIAAGADATHDLKSAPVAVMGGMVRLFFALGLIEAASLAVKYI